MDSDPLVITPSSRMLAAFEALADKVGERMPLKFVIVRGGRMFLSHRSYEAEIGSGKPTPANSDEAAGYLRDAYTRLRAAMVNERNEVSKALGSEK